jgi:hypothetical protein
MKGVIKEKLIKEKYEGRNLVYIENEIERLVKGAAEAYGMLKMKSVKLVYDIYIDDARIIFGHKKARKLMVDYPINHGAGTD